MFKNLTPHAINILSDEKVTETGNGKMLEFNEMTIEPSGTVARCSVHRAQVETIDRVVINKTVFGEVTGVPSPEKGVYLIVSSLVAQALVGRSDILIPDDTVRDNEGRIIGCRALARI